jgi:hypothetical protein
VTTINKHTASRTLEASSEKSTTGAALKKAAVAGAAAIASAPLLTVAFASPAQASTTPEKLGSETASNRDWKPSRAYLEMVDALHQYKLDVGCTQQSPIDAHEMPRASSPTSLPADRGGEMRSCLLAARDNVDTWIVRNGDAKAEKTGVLALRGSIESALVEVQSGDPQRTTAALDQVAAKVQQTHSDEEAATAALLSALTAALVLFGAVFGLVIKDCGPFAKREPDEG